MLAFLAIKTNDKVGAILFSSDIEKYIPPKKGASHVWRLIKEIYTYKPLSHKTDIDNALSYLNRVAKRHSIVFLISDCIDEDYERTLSLTAKKHDLTLIRLTDKAEVELPDVGLISIKDPETGESVIVNSSDKSIRKQWFDYLSQNNRRLQEIMNKTNVDMVEIFTDGPVVEPLMLLFEKRGRRQ